MKVYILHFASYDPHTIYVYADEARAAVAAASWNIEHGPGACWYDEYPVIS